VFVSMGTVSTESVQALRRQGARPMLYSVYFDGSGTQPARMDGRSNASVLMERST